MGGVISRKSTGKRGTGGSIEVGVGHPALFFRNLFRYNMGCTLPRWFHAQKTKAQSLLAGAKTFGGPSQRHTSPSSRGMGAFDSKNVRRSASRLAHFFFFLRFHFEPREGRSRVLISQSKASLFALRPLRSGQCKPWIPLSTARRVTLRCFCAKSLLCCMG